MVLIEQMRKRHGQVRPDMECTFTLQFLSSLYIDLLSGHEMDVRNLSFEAESFDIAIDKGALSQSYAKYFHRNIW